MSASYSATALPRSSSPSNMAETYPRSKVALTFASYDTLKLLLRVACPITKRLKASISWLV